MQKCRVRVLLLIFVDGKIGVREVNEEEDILFERERRKAMKGQCELLEICLQAAKRRKKNSDVATVKKKEGC